MTRSELLKSLRAVLLGAAKLPFRYLVIDSTQLYKYQVNFTIWREGCFCHNGKHLVTEIYGWN
jgi:hypothetical protein